MLTKSKIPEIVQQYEEELLTDWVREQMTGGTRRDDLIRESEVREQSREFLRLFRDAASRHIGDVQSTA